jgi:hypothetical protein
MSLVADPPRDSPGSAGRHRSAGVGLPGRPSSTPVRLRLAVVSLTVLLGLVAALSAGLVAVRRSALERSTAQTEPLALDAQTAYVSLSDADSTAAGALLSSPAEPASLRARYQQDIADAAAAVSAAEPLATTDPAVTADLRTLSVGVPTYTAAVERAATNNRLGFPVAGSYQGEANAYMRTTLLPAAESAYRTGLTRLRAEQSTASATWPEAVALGAAVGAVLLLVLVQVWLSRRFHRRLNVGLLAATVLVLVVAGWLAVALATEGSDVDAARTHGSAPLAAYTTARILALQATADDELSLVTRDSDPSYQKDYATVAAQLSSVVGSLHDAVVSDTRETLAESHASIRRLAGGGDFLDAVASATDPFGNQSRSLPEVSRLLQGDLTAGVLNSQAGFESATDRATSLLGVAGTGLVVLTLVALACGLAGLAPRVREYR